MRHSKPVDEGEQAWPNVLVWALLIVFSFAQRVGETTFDTKLDLAVDPGGFLERTLTAWNPMSAFGELQNQAYGYLFPHGLFFLLGDQAGLPMWVIQRLWSAVLLVVAYEGARRLFAAIDHERRPWLPLVAGLAYALSPRLLGLSGALTGEIHPSSVLPWVVLPLVLALRGLMRPLHAAAWSGVGIVFMGGVNASEVLLALVLPGILILSAWRTPVGRRLMLWWPVAVIMSTAWWVTGLLIQGRYSPPFLDYIETAAATTQPLGWTNVVRGSDHWLSFVWVGGRPWWSGSYQLATDPWLIGLTGFVSAVSLYGLVHRKMPWRVPFAISAVVAILVLTLGHLDSIGSPFTGTFRALLDGALSPFRNIHKIDPVMRLPMALGFAHATGLLVVAVQGLFPHRIVGSYGRWVRLGAVGMVVLLLLLSGRPLFTDDLRKRGWDAIPTPWRQAAEYLQAHSGQGRAMVLPGSGFGQQDWGWTIDEPLQPLAKSPWVSRSQVPLAPGSTIRYLDAIEERIQDGLGSPVLADALARAGIKHVLVRRDLDLWATEAPTPARVDLALSRSPGLRKVASYGTAEFGGQAMIEVYEVERNVPLLEAVDLTSVKTLSGGPEDAVTAMEAGLLRPGEVTVNKSEPGWRRLPDVVGDGFRRRERQFGRLVDATSQVMSADEQFRTKRKAHDYAGVDEKDRVVARYTSLAAVTASSSSGYVDSFGSIRPENGPFAAVDGSEDTYWQSAPLENPKAQWLEFRFTEPEPMTEMRIVASTEVTTGSPIRRLRVEVGDRSYVRSVDPGTGEVLLPLPGSTVDRVRIQVLDVFGDPDYGMVAIREVEFEGIDIERSFALPDNGATGETAFVFRSRPHRRACVSVNWSPQCDPGSARTSEEESGMKRIFTTRTPGTYRVSAKVVARSTAEAAQLLDPYPNQLRAVASSVINWDPGVAGQRAVDKNPSTAWIAQRGDTAPSLTLDWGEERTVDRLTFEAADVQGSQPVMAVLEAGDERREVDLTTGSMGYFEPIRASSVKVTFPMKTASPTGEPLAPLAVGELHLGGLEKVKAPYDGNQRTGSQCGFGPEVVLDGKTHATRVRGTMDDVTGGTPLDLELCETETVTLQPGEHELTVASTAQYATTALTLAPDGGAPVAETVRGRAVNIVDWGITERTVTVGPGPDSVLRVPENVNTGWVATLDGQVLEPLRLDGWQQGFRLPEGQGGTVSLEFIPDRTYRVQMYLGALAALAVFAIAVLAELRRTGAPLGPPTRLPAFVGRPRRRDWVLAVVAGYLLGGVPLAGGLFAAGFLIRRGLGTGLLASLLVVAASTAQAVSSWRGEGINVGWADWVAGIAIGLFTAALVGPDEGDGEP